MSTRKIVVMVVGLPGKMATLVAEAIMRQSDMTLWSRALAEERGTALIGAGDPTMPTKVVELVPSYLHEDALRRAVADGVDLIVDFALPQSVNRNVDLYCAAGIRFVMVAAGDDLDKLDKSIAASEISAVTITNTVATIDDVLRAIRFLFGHRQERGKGFSIVDVLHG